MEYSTLQSKLILPEYGRNIQSMVEYACTIQDKAEREACVKGIMRAMMNLFPYLKNEESRHTLYDHMAVMSGFRLDIDYPYGEPKMEELVFHPNPLPYNTDQQVRMRQYGKNVETMVAYTMSEQDPDKRKFLTNVLANRMKYLYLVHNKDQVENERIIEDIHILSNGALTCDFPEFHLAHAWQLLGKDKRQQQWKKKN